MSRAHDGQHRSPFPFGNLFKAVRTKDSRLSKVGKIQESFEQSLTENLTKLRQEETSDITSFSWLRCNLGYLCELHMSISSLITELDLPVSNWDQQWIDIYLDDSVKLLDLCNAFSSGISSIEHCQLLLQCTLHVLGKANGPPSQEQVKRADGYLSEWRQTIDSSRNPKLESSSSILDSLSGSLRVPNFKKSAKGRVLMRAMYAVKAITIFVCSVLLAALTSSSQHLIDFQVPKEFPWAEAFDGLQKDVGREFRRKLPLGRATALKEMDAVGVCVDKLFPVGSANLETKNTLHAGTASEHKEPEELKPTDDVEDEKPTTAMTDLASDLESRTKILGDELDDLAKKMRDFFQIVMDGRDALLSNLRKSEFLQVKSFRKSKSI